MVKLIPAASALISASAFSNATMGMPIIPFLTEGWIMPKTTHSSNSDNIALAELFTEGFGMQASHLKSGTPIWDQVKVNLNQNGFRSVAMLVAAKVVPKLLSKTGVTRNGNKLLKSLQLGSIIQL
jgi:hypothetical protein